jgi:hypothetical protein
MTFSNMLAAVLLGIGFLGQPAAHAPSSPAPLRVLLSEVELGRMASEHHCMLVFDDHHFHREVSHRKAGKDRDRMVYEGQLKDADWNALVEILDAKQLRELQVPASTPALVVQDPHTFTISIARQNGFQNMEFLTKDSLKPYETELNPLLKWWKVSRNTHLAESEAPVDSRCSLTSANAIFGN